MGLEDNGQELERYLWRDFFRFYYGTEESAIGYETAVVRIRPQEKEDEAVFEFLIGGVSLRSMYLFLSQAFAVPEANYPWGIKKIILSLPRVIEGKMGEEDRVFEFHRENGEQFADYQAYVFNNQGDLVEKGRVALFRYGQPWNLGEEEFHPTW